MQHDHDHPEQPRPPKQEQERATTEVTEVAPGVLRTQLPIEMPGLGHVNCYVLEDERGIAVVDPGLPGDDAWNDLVGRLGLAGYRVADVHTVIVTHSHPDHFGGAARLRAETDAEIVSHELFHTIADRFPPADEDSGSLEVNSADARAEAIDRFFSGPTPWGGKRQAPPPEVLDRIKAGTDGAWYMPDPTNRLVDGQIIRLARRDWIALHTPGHTADHLCLFDPEHGTLFTGDHVLPTITPHIGGLTAGTDPLAQFFESLQRMIGLEGVTLALPAHGHPFAEVATRSADIVEHHHARLDIIRDALVDLPNGSVNDFMRVLFRERSWGEMAESETFAHLEHLRQLGELRSTDQAGLLRYTSV